MGNDQSKNTKQESKTTAALNPEETQQQQHQQPKPFVQIKNPFPEVPNYTQQIKQEAPPQNMYPKVPNYLTPEVLLDISKLKEILVNAEKSQNICRKYNDSKLIEVKDQQSSIKVQQSYLLSKIQNESKSQIIDYPQPDIIRQNQFMQSIKQIAKYAYYCQGMLSKLSNQSKEYLVQLNNLILSVNMNQLLMQYIGYYEDETLIMNAKKLYKEFLNSYEFDSTIQYYLKIVVSHLETSSKVLQNLQDCSNVFCLEDQEEVNLIQVYEGIMNLFDSKKRAFNLQELLELKIHIQLGEELAEKIVKEQQVDEFIKNKIDQDEGSQRFIELLKQILSVIEYKTQNWEGQLLDVLKVTKDKSKLRNLLYEFSKLQIESSLSMIHFCINKLQSSMEQQQSNNQFQRVVQKIDKN